MNVRANLAALEKQRGGWFEPAIRFVKASREAGLCADIGTNAEKRDFLRKTGSNLTLKKP
jgi:hypothetical protein